MAKQKVLILGGGMAGLTTAYELSRTPELRARYDVSVASLGWRLGGKLASGRETAPPNQSHEHGLHVWFGFYDNAFAMLRELYARWNKPASCPFRTWDAVLRPESFTPIGGAVDGVETPWLLQWPTNPGVPGDGRLSLTPWESFVELLNALELMIEKGLAAVGVKSDDASFTEALLARVGLSATQVPVRTAMGALRFAKDNARTFINDGVHGGIDDDARRVLAAFISGLLRVAQLALSAFVAPLTPNNVNAHDLLSLAETGFAFARGILNPAYGIVDDGNLDRVDYLDFREFLVDNGCDKDVASSWRGIKSLYDCCFQYVDGDVSKPNFAAGTAARVVMRIVTQYKGAVLWLFNAGVGESVIAPLYEVLVDQGVSFRFFHEVQQLKLGPDRKSVVEVVLHEQVKTTAAAYQPLFNVEGFRCWPTQPLWDQLENGAALQAQGVDFESPWGPKPAGVQHHLQHGVDFDTVVLATPLGPCMQLNSADKSIVDDLLAVDDHWQRMVETTGLSPSLALELWMKPTLPALGWPHGSPAAVGIPYPAAVWADMTPVLDVETWTDAEKPGSLHYFCGTLGSTLYRQPRSAPNVQQRATADANAALVPFLDDRLATYWPSAVVPGTRRIDPALIASKKVRANVSPTECCETTPAGSTQYKMAADQSGFKNLVLAGAWVRTGINASCVEAAVMSGMQASRAISGSPRVVVGEDFWHIFPGERPHHSRLPRFLSRLGRGEQAVAPPGIVKGAKTYCWFVPGDNAAMQRTVDAFLNAGSGGAAQYTVLGNHALLSYLDGQALTSLVEEMGFISDRECALWIPLLQKKPGQLLPEPMLWMPYVVVDQSIACVTGREVWGFLKEVGSLSFPGDAGSDGSFVANAMTFLTLNSALQGEVRPLLRVRHSSGTAGQTTGPVATALDDSLDDVLAGLAGVADAAIVKKLLQVNVPLVNLKQFRDAEHPDRACYQALITSSCRVEQLHSVSLLLDQHVLDVLPCESHQIAADLGLSTSTNLPLGPGICIDMDFSIQPGKRV